MSDELEKFKIMVDMAKENGRKESVCNMQEAELKKLREEVEMLQQKVKQDASTIKKLEKKNKESVEYIKELELMVAQNSKPGASQGPTIVVKNFIVLSKPKTIEYVSMLNDNQRMFAGHMLEHTLADEVTNNGYEYIRKMTELGDMNHKKDLTDAIKEAATHPATVIQTVETMTQIPSVSNYQPQIETQNVSMSDIPQKNLLDNEQGDR